MTPEDLKPCPFCGGDAIRRAIKYEDGLAFHIICRVCGVQTDVENAMESAKTIWNKREKSND